jgi:hypothetical protein
LSFETGNRGGKQKLRQFQTPLEAVEHLVTAGGPAEHHHD